MNPQQARELLFGEALACQSEMPAALRSRAAEAGSVERAIEHAETVLRALAVIEETPHEEPEERGKHEVGLQRVEAKLNLVLETLAGILRRERSDLPVQNLRWSRFGAELMHTGADIPERGFLLLQPLAWLPQRLELPVETLASLREGQAPARLWLRFDPLPPSLETALEKHLFRQHRRQLAARKPS